MLGLTHSKPFVIDPEYEFDAPVWADLRQEEEDAQDWTSERAAQAEREADEWFSFPHPLHRSKEEPGPPQVLFDTSDLSPFPSPAPAQLSSRVSPGPRRTPAVAAAGMLGSAARMASARKGQGRLASPIAIHSSLHSTPLKKSLAAAAAAAAAAAGGAGSSSAAPGMSAILTPLKLLPESAGKARVVALRTPGSASKGGAAMHTGAQRVLAGGHRIVFDTIEESGGHGSSAVSMFSPERKSRAQRVSVAYVPAPTAHAVAPITAAAAAHAGRVYADENAHNVAVPAAPVAGAVSKATRSRVVAAAGKPGVALTLAAGGGVATGAAPPSRKRRSNDKGPAPAPTAAAPAMVELDSELEALLSKHNEQIAQSQAAEDELAAVLSAHNRALQQQQQQGANRSSPGGAGKPVVTRKKSRATLAPTVGSGSGPGSGSGDILGSGNKAPKKKARMAGTAAATSARGSAEYHPPLSVPVAAAAAASSARARSQKKKSSGSASVSSFAASSSSSLSKSTSNGALSSRPSTSTHTRKSMAPASFSSSFSTSSSASFSHRSPSTLSPTAQGHTARVGGARRTRSSTAAAAAAATASLNSSMVTDSPTPVPAPTQARHSSAMDDADADDLDAADISFRVEDLLDPEELAASAAAAVAAAVAPVPMPVAAPGVVAAARPRKSMGKALRLQQADLLDGEDDDSMIDAMIALDDPLPVAPAPAPAPAPRRIQAAVNFTAAAASSAVPTRSRSRPATATATAATSSRKSVGHALSNSRSGNIMPSTSSTSSSAASKPAKSGAATARPATATGAGSKSVGAKKAAASSSSSLAASASSLASSRHKYLSQSTAVQAASSLFSEDDELAALLSAHNASLRPKAAFVARAGTAAQLRAWESAHGRKWHQLNSDERERANVQMVAAAM